MMRTCIMWWGQKLIAFLPERVSKKLVNGDCTRLLWEVTRAILPYGTCDVSVRAVSHGPSTSLPDRFNRP
jgi:hypothetical protein